MDRVILHSDLNNFYASVECLYRPEIRHKPVAVCGDPAARQGIVLAKNYPAKATGIKTGEAIWQARQKCPGLVVVPPNFPLYLRFAHLAREIYADYTDQIEPFGLDEAWLDVTGSREICGDGVKIADEIRERIKFEMGVTASVGVSYNKIFAKLGSDMKKPDATTVITHDNFKELVWPLPAGDLLYVGRATQRKLARRGINSIGDIAQSPPEYLKSFLGKWGEVLWSFANGNDHSPVTRISEAALIKSVGNSITTPRDLENDADVEMVFYVLSESVAARLRKHGLKCRTAQIHIRDNSLFSFDAQGKFLEPTHLSSDLAEKAMELFRAQYGWARPIRSLGVRGCNLVTAENNEQLCLFADEEKRLKQEKVEATVDVLRHRFGHLSIQRAVLLQDTDFRTINPQEDHVIHPVGFFKPGKLP
ncbi:DNA polymerase IV [Syntrophomonas zehnderi OL-4]|uniref:DNA polymerase IV n=1 Tax=Syntrophomonas zehnderi OL-4 TaxID=690567 RepID=A0A0E4G9S2_9FIRM|nr:DNA polymerase IV [Syntrophomonas zehnderi]CFX23586.1 DNA polymerase IV [Syntrophomonas zehnderi OL-4]